MYAGLLRISLISTQWKKAPTINDDIVLALNDVAANLSMSISEHHHSLC